MKDEKEIRYTNKKDRIGCELRIYTGDKMPQFITEKTGVGHSQLREKGKPYLNYRTNKISEHNICKENIWIYAHEIKTSIEGVYLNHVLSELLEVIKSKEGLFKEIFFDKEFKSLILCYGYYYDYHIYFRLETELIKKLNELNLLLDFDIYSFKKNEHIKAKP